MEDKEYNEEILKMIYESEARREAFNEIKEDCKKLPEIRSRNSDSRTQRWKI